MSKILRFSSFHSPDEKMTMEESVPNFLQMWVPCRFFWVFRPCEQTASCHKVPLGTLTMISSLLPFGYQVGKSPA